MVVVCYCLCEYCVSILKFAPKMINKGKLQKLGDHDEFINRIKKSLYYGQFPHMDRFSLPVTELAAELFSEVKRGYSLDRLHAEDAAQISRNACVSPCSLVLALLYLDRLHSCNAEYLKTVPPTDLFLVSMMVASKFLHDDGEEDEVFNDEWATSGNVELKHLNRLEREFLDAINWEVYVSEQKFNTGLRRMEAQLALRQGKRRGWFSYTELTSLIHAVELLSLAHTFITVSAVCLTSYTASVLAMVGSSLLVHQVPSLACSLVSSPPASLLTSTPPPLVLHSAASSSSCLLNETLLDDSEPLLPTLDEEEDAQYFFSENEEETQNLSAIYGGLHTSYLRETDWLTNLVRVASTPTNFPSFIMPIETH